MKKKKLRKSALWLQGTFWGVLMISITFELALLRFGQEGLSGMIWLCEFLALPIVFLASVIIFIVSFFVKEKGQEKNTGKDDKVYKMLSQTIGQPANHAENKTILDSKEVLSVVDEYRSKRKGMIFLVIFGVWFWFFVLLVAKVLMLEVYIVPSTIAIVCLCLWIIKRNGDMNAFLKGEFFITKSAVGYKYIEENDDSDGLLTYNDYILFPGYEEYELDRMSGGVLYDRIKCGDEYYLVVFDKNDKKIEQLYSADAYELSNEFYLSGDEWRLKNKKNFGKHNG